MSEKISSVVCGGKLSSCGHDGKDPEPNNFVLFALYLFLGHTYFYKYMSMHLQYVGEV